MAISEKRMKHPRFVDVSKAVNDAINDIADSFDIGITELEMLRPSFNRVADDFTATILRAWDINHK